MALPDRIPIRYEPDYRSWCIGHYDDGQFLLGHPPPKITVDPPPRGQAEERRILAAALRATSA